MDLNRKIVSFNIPNGAFYLNGNLPYTADKSIELLGVTHFTYNNVTYDITDYEGGVGFIIIFTLTSRNTRIRVNVYGTLPPYNVITTPIINDDYRQYPSGGNFITNRCYCNNTGYYTNSEINSAYDSYVTDYGLTTQANISGSNITIVHNPILSFDDLGVNSAWGTRFTINTGNDIIIRADDGYKFVNGDFTVTTNGQDITSKVLISNDEKEISLNCNTNILYDQPYGTSYLYYGALDVVITCNPTAVPRVNIVNNLSDVNNDNLSTDVAYGGSYIATLTPISGYYISSVSISMDGLDITLDVYNSQTGEINIPSVTGELVITAVGGVNPTVTNNLTHCTTNNPDTSVEYKSRYQATITPDSGYSLEDARVLITMGGIEQFNVYNNGLIDIPSVTGDIVILIIATEIKTFNFYSADGNTLYASISAVRLTSIKLSLVGSTRTLIVNNQSFTWVSVIPENKDLYGLALTPNADKWFIPLDIEVQVNYSVSTSFYEVILDESIKPLYFSLMLYKNRAESHRVDKSSYLEYKGTLEGVLRKACSIISPEIDIVLDGTVDFNYIYVPIWNRYYYVIDVIYLKKNLCLIRMKVDTLMSFKNIIYNQSGLISRNEFTYNDYLLDNERYVISEPIIDVIQLTTGGLFGEDIVSFVLNVIGGEN